MSTRRSSSSGRPERPPSSSGRSSRNAAPPAVEDGGDYAPSPAVDTAGNMPEETTMSPPPKGSVTVGRSLEITTTPDVCMEQLIDKLKLLEYERDFCRKKKPYRKPMSRLYFAATLPSGNQSEQFFYFTGLTSWLLGLAGIDFPAPKEFDDPNLTCNNIVASLKKLGFAQPSYPAMKLTVGYGKEVCGVIDGLVDYVLEKRNYSYKKPIYLPDGYVEEAEVDDDPDMAAAEGAGADEFPMPQYADEQEEEEAYMAPAGLAPPTADGALGAAGAAAGPDAAEKAMLHSKVDPTLWKLELERVTPKLRILLNADAKDWRSHLEEVHNHSKTISTAWPENRTVLEKLRGDLNNSLEKLTTRERFLNEQFERLMQQYRASRQQLQEIQEGYNKRTEAISDRNNDLHRISEQLEEMKTLMDEKGNNISDATPVVRIKGAIKKLSEELHEMEVRIGVVSHTLLQLSLKTRRAMHSQAAIMSDDEDM
mmetsp:Transcript_14908/g.32320  ORF Transcript_14908/g.32320 Transcript_14908/m.32320 type:complete len:480 (-) Transcript_14908:727-2166(-)